LRNINIRKDNLIARIERIKIFLRIKINRRHFVGFTGEKDRFSETKQILNKLLYKSDG